MGRAHGYWIKPVMALSDVREWLKHHAPTVSIHSCTENDEPLDLLGLHSLGSAGLTRPIADARPSQVSCLVSRSNPEKASHHTGAPIQ